MKIKILTILLIIVSGSNCYAAFKSDTSTSLDTNNIAFTETVSGISAIAGVRFKLTEQVLSDIFELETKDSIFVETEGFFNKILSGEIKHEYGGRLNLGYEINKFRIFASSGYLVSNFEYIENSQDKQNISEAVPFFGAGIGYDLTKNISLRLNSMIYSLDTKPKNSEFSNIEIDVTSVNLGLALHF